MTDEFRTSQSEPGEVTDEQLDQLLQSVRWPEMNAAKQDRLVRFVDREMRKSQSVTPLSLPLPWVVTTVCTVLVLVLFVSWFLFLKPNSNPTAVELETEKGPSEAVDPAPAVTGNKTSPAWEVELPATYLSALVRSQKAETTASTPNWERPSACVQSELPRGITPHSWSLASYAQRFAEQWVRSEIGYRILVASTDAIEWINDQRLQYQPWTRREQWVWLVEMHRQTEQRFLEMARAPTVSQQERTVVYNWLSAIGTRRSMSTLIQSLQQQSVTDPVVRDRVLSTVVARANSNQLSLFAVQMGVDAKVKIMSALLTRGDPVSFQQYLLLADRLGSKELVERSAAQAKSLPTEFVIRELHSQRFRFRLIAALTLSKHSDPTVSQRLIRMTARPDRARAALLALLIRTDSDAKQFIQFAESNLQLASTVHSVRQTWSRLEL